MSQQHAPRRGDEDDDDSAPRIVAPAGREDDQATDDGLLQEIDNVLEDAVIYEQFVQKNGQ